MNSEIRSFVCEACKEAHAREMILARIHSEKALEKITRAHKTLSLCNMTLIQATEEPKLLDDICRLIVNVGKYKMAWVGFINPADGKTVHPVAHAGGDDGVMEEFHFSLVNEESGSCAIRGAINTGGLKIVPDMRTEKGCLSCRFNALDRGYMAFISLPLHSSGTNFGILNIYASEPDAFDPEEVKLLEELANDLAFGILTLRTRAERDQALRDRQIHLDRLREALEDTVQAITATIEMRDPYTAGHERRVADLAEAIAREMGLPEEEIHVLRIAGIVHDLGKIYIPAEILSKPRRLNDAEFNLIKLHPQVGYDILKEVKFPWPVATMVLQHHERLDGSGYPQGLKGSDIMLEARILTVADEVEAMASHRPYRPSLGLEWALDNIWKRRGIHYDPDVVDACTKLFLEKGYSFEKR